jgi:anthranilate phosphoribosyltransferase
MGPFRDAVLLNAAAGLLVLGVVDNLKSGVEQAADALGSGAAEQTLSVLSRESRGSST